MTSENAEGLSWKIEGGDLGGRWKEYLQLEVISRICLWPDNVDAGG